ncbi:Protein of unknown function [Pseudonocardia thermophila]|uniref:DUF3093 domain-containing protein n=1 Tax=Pseudonocardia thermophila TaxID=1848 RepID=A0A1M6ZM45_PSETH|nr:DUF3093 domain-containing protein [Pseudonocardia thermophila]SHL31474.1 Protein of unknown function [Pseudonocardia thermophila]
MREQQNRAADATSGRSGFDERLSVPLWWYLPAVGLGVLLGAEIHMGYPGIRSWIGYVTLIPLFVLALVWLGRSRVQVTQTELVVGERRLPLTAVGRADVVEKSGKQEALGPQLDPTAYLLHRPWIGSVVRVEVLDGADPAPYWVFSTRRPKEVLAALGR